MAVSRAAGAARAEDSTDLAREALLARVDSIAGDCCRMFTVACVQLKYTPRCDCLPHLSSEPYVPCDRCVCIDPPCHMPVTPCDPGGGWCLPEACHLPAVVALPEDCCE